MLCFMIRTWKKYALLKVEWFRAILSFYNSWLLSPYHASWKQKDIITWQIAQVPCHAYVISKRQNKAGISIVLTVSWSNQQGSEQPRKSGLLAFTENVVWISFLSHLFNLFLKELCNSWVILKNDLPI